MKLLHAPIIEAVLEIDCDMSPKFELVAMEDRARRLFADNYPKFRKQYVEEYRIKAKADQPPDYSTKRAIQSLQFFQEDERQIVQLRGQGFSFNRLNPYSSLDDYLPEIERTWKLFGEIVSPLQIRAVRLRYINRILLPMVPGGIQLNEFFKIYPVLPDGTLILGAFLNQYLAVEKDTGNHVNVVLTGQPPENDRAPIIFDNTAMWSGVAEVENWAWLSARIMLLRALKNRIFENTLTEKCLNLFQQQ
jgi:uncharacterized protein (TIGR04255 family)